MPTPEGIQTVTLHGLFVEPDEAGTPLSGTLTFTPNPSLITFPDQNTIMTGTEIVTLDLTGQFTVELPCTDTPNQNPTGWVYSVTEKLNGITPRTYNIALPFTLATVELADITPTQAAPQYLPVVGPQGPPGVVHSVNGYSVADIVLNADDVGALSPADVGVAGGVLGIEAGGWVYVNSSLGVGINNPGARFMVSSAQDELLAVIDHQAAGSTQPGLKLKGTLSSWSAVAIQLTADTQPRLALQCDGLSWSDGSSAPDITLYRVTPGLLVTSGQMATTQSAPTANNHFTRKDYVDGLNSSNVKLTGNQTVAGSKTFTSDTFVTGSRLGVGITSSLQARTHVVSTVDEITVQAQQTTVAGTQPQFSSVSFDTTGTGFAAKVNADSVNRIALRASGNIEFGAGNIARDVTFYRSAAGILNSSGQLASDAAAPSAASHLTRKDYVDNNFSSLAGNQTITGQKTYSSAVLLTRGAAANTTAENRVTGDTSARWSVQADGKMAWGPGGVAATDLNLYRASTGLLKTDQNFEANNYRVILDWVALSTTGTFQSGFAANATSPPRMRKFVQGGTEVWEYEGDIDAASVAAGATLTPFIFDVGYRPTVTRPFNFPGNSIQFHSWFAQIASNGNMNVGLPSGVTTSASTRISLNSIRITNPL